MPSTTIVLDQKNTGTWGVNTIMAMTNTRVSISITKGNTDFKELHQIL